MKSIPNIIKNKTYYLDKDICNVIISTPQVIETDRDKYFIGYPKNNVSGYTTASHQTNYDCFLTDYLENIKYIFNNMILGYYLMAFGLVNLLEVLLTILIRNPRLDNALTSIFGLAPVKTTKKKVVLKEIKKKKINKNTKD